MVVFHSYVSLPEGNGMIDGIPMGCLPPIYPIYTWDDHGNH